jgi:hypothetical protein
MVAIGGLLSVLEAFGVEVGCFITGVWTNCVAAGPESLEMNVVHKMWNLEWWWKKYSERNGDEKRKYSLIYTFSYFHRLWLFCLLVAIGMQTIDVPRKICLWAQPIFCLLNISIVFLLKEKTFHLFNLA